MNIVAVSCEHEGLSERAKLLAERLSLSLVKPYSRDVRFLLVVTDTHLELRSVHQPFSPVVIDFSSGAHAYRRKFGGGKSQLIATAVGLKKYKNIKLLDVTAGYGADGFVLATLGCDVTLLERAPVVAALLQDGIERGKQHDWFADLPLMLKQQSGLTYLMGVDPGDYDVIYIDPMFPDVEKSALVKKEMRILRELVGDDTDSGALLVLALGRAGKRVVVKRPAKAPFLMDKEPDFQYKGESCRFDVYSCSH